MTIQPKSEWLIVIQDLPGKSHLRAAVRADHLAAMKADGQMWLWGGPILEGPALEGLPLPGMTGSVMLAWARTREELVIRVGKDPMAKEIWDLNNVQIWSVKSMIRSPLPNPPA